MNPAALPLAFGALALALASIAPARLGLGAEFLVGAVGTYIAAGALIVRRAEALTKSGFGAANAATLARLTIACLLTGYVAVLFTGFAPSAAQSTSVFGIAVAALLLDALDGWLARKTATVSAFGARFDMEVDALLILILSIAAWATGKAGVWVLMSGAARYLYVAAASVVPTLREPMVPSQRRRAIAAIQATILVALTSPLIAPPVSSALAAGALALLLYSFASDMIWQFGARAARMAR